MKWLYLQTIVCFSVEFDRVCLVDKEIGTERQRDRETERDLKPPSIIEDAVSRAFVPSQTVRNVVYHLDWVHTIIGRLRLQRNKTLYYSVVQSELATTRSISRLPGEAS